MPLDLPRPVVTYLAAEKAKDVEMFDLCFADNAVVLDESHDHRGIPAIKAWKREADAKYQFVLEPLDSSTDGDVVTVRSRVAGNFPGSPVELRFMFTVADDKIRELNIRP